MTPELRIKIDELISLDNERQLEEERKYPNGMFFKVGGPEGQALVNDILNGNPSPIYRVLEKLTKDELIYVMALMWYGRGDGIAEPGTTFESVLDYAKGEIDDMTVTYVGGKPLGRYLTQGLKRLGVN